MRAGLDAVAARAAQREVAGKRRPRVFFEEWDEPHISAIRWVSELVGLAGGAGALRASVAGRMADRGQAQVATALSVGLLLLGWVALWLGASSLAWFVVGMLVADLALQVARSRLRALPAEPTHEPFTFLVDCRLWRYRQPFGAADAGAGLGGARHAP